MTAELSSLTAKMDALRAKGFSDEEINALLSPVAVAAQPNPLPLSENDKAYAEQWNENIEETARTSWKVFFSCLVGMVITALPLINAAVSGTMVGRNGVYWFLTGFISIAIAIVYVNYQQEQRVKCFLKKRVD